MERRLNKKLDEYISTFKEKSQKNSNERFRSNKNEVKQIIDERPKVRFGIISSLGEFEMRFTQPMTMPDKDKFDYSQVFTLEVRLKSQNNTF